MSANSDARSLPAEAVARAELRPGETLLWAGRGDPALVGPEVRRQGWRSSALVLIGIMIYALTAEARGVFGGDPTVAETWILTIVQYTGLGLWLFGAFSMPVAASAHGLHRRVYAVTDRGALLIRKTWNPGVQRLSPAEIAARAPELRLRSDGGGSIHLQRRFGESEFVLHGLDEPEWVFALLRQISTTQAAEGVAATATGSKAPA